MHYHIPSYKFLGKIFIILLATLSLVFCNSMRPSSSPESVTVPEELELPEMMGVALDPAGIPIPLAEVGGEIGDFNGVISGDLEVSESGWLEVESSGYATGFTESFGEIEGVELFEARLTPFAAIATLESGEMVTLSLGEEDAFDVEVEISADSFAVTPITIALTEVDPLDIGPAHETVDDRDDLNLHYAFALQAFDAAWVEQSAEMGSVFTTHIYLPDEFEGLPILAVFNPIDGEWEALTDLCTSESSTTLICDLNRLSPSFGIFSEMERATSVHMPDARNNQSESGGGHQLSLIMWSPLLQDENLDGAYKQARDKLMDWIKQNQFKFYTPSDDEFDLLTDPEFLDLLDDLIDAALRYANANRNESGKYHLMLAAEIASLAGTDDLQQAMIDEAAKISKEMGDKILKNPDCGKFKEAFRIAEQNFLFANNALATQIVETYADLVDDCDIWEGKIIVHMPTLETAPHDDSFTRVSGNTWIEIHTVRIGTNVETFASRAEDSVMYLFPVVKYDASEECPMKITYTLIPTVKPMLTAKGSYDGFEFVMDNFKILPGSGSATINQHWNFQGEQGDPPECVTAVNQSFPFKNFYSVLAHGFMGGTPSITLQEMLDSGDPLTGHITGSRQIENPDQETGRFPISHGSVGWNFRVIQKKLPIEES